MGLRDALKTGSNYFYVVQGGIISSAIVLLALWAAAEYWPRVEIMGWCYMVIPVGAIAAGFAAALGYMLAAMHVGSFIPRWFWAPIILLQLSVYIAADYVEYRRLTWDYDPPPISYPRYFSIHSRSLRLVDGDGNESLVSGYALRAMQMAGFAAPGLLVPLCVASIPRCRKCQGARTSQKIATLLSVPETLFEDWRSAHKPEDFDTEREARAAYFEEHVTNLLCPLTDAVAANQPDSIQAALEALRSQSDTVTAPHCITILETDHCKSCLSGRLIITYRYQERGRPRFDGLPAIPIEIAVVDALTAQAA